MLMCSRSEIGIRGKVRKMFVDAFFFRIATAFQKVSLIFFLHNVDF
jgi:hypothetical protein